MRNIRKLLEFFELLSVQVPACLPDCKIQLFTDGIHSCDHFMFEFKCWQQIAPIIVAFCFGPILIQTDSN